MRRRQARWCSRRRESALPRLRRAAPHWQRARCHPRLGGNGRRELVAFSFRPASLCILGPPARLGRSTLEAACHSRAQLAAEQALRLGAQELSPAWAAASRRRPQARAAQDGRDRRGRDADPELQQLALDAHVAPAGVLARQPPDQAARFGRKRGTARSAPLFATSLQQCPVPAAKRARADRKAGPALAGKQTAYCRQQRSVDGRVPRPPPAAPEDRQLVAQHDDLELPLTTAVGEHADTPAQEPVQHTGQHDAAV
jgi:hypothetical protein